MLAFAIAMQVAQPAPVPPAPVAGAVSAPQLPVAPPVAAPVPSWGANGRRPAPQPVTPPGAATAPAQPAGSSFGRWGRSGWTPAQPAGAAAITKRPNVEPELNFFTRLEMGLGPRGFGPNNALLDKVGYDGVKTWFMLDAAYMISQRWGLGLFAGLNRRASAPGGGSAALNAVGYFVGAEAPIVLWGQHTAALHLTPRLGFLTGQVELRNRVDAPMQQTAIFGGALSFQSFRHHIGASAGYLFAPAGSPGELGGNHDFGGLYLAISGSIDG